MLRAFFLLPALALLAACSESSPSVSGSEETSKSASVVRASKGPVSWGAALLNLVPSRSGNAVTSETEVRAQFSACKFGTSGASIQSGECAAEQMIPSRPQGNDRLQLQMLTDAGSIAALRLVVCCSEESIQPFQSEPVIRAEKLCPEVTLVASQSAHVFRVSAPGKRDFIHAEISHGAGTKTVISHTILLAPSEAGSECTDIVAAEKRLDAQFGLPTAEL